ncbi:hypothetical protein [Alicycliphilus denitrificans]|uniref:hypothetical protein n=1 Tax=Alicycliphilus denitrificans TaxID=179636 RepID=UPI0011D2301A|nr:hypothetical protein [Alicycliphilus denitrificans]
MFDGFLKYLPSVLVVLGWAIAYKLQALQARRKLLREEVEKTRQAVEKLREIALQFHVNVYDPEKRGAIVIALTDIERRYGMFPEIARARSECSFNAVDISKTRVDAKYLTELRQAITLEHFEDPESAPLQHGHEQLERITVAASALIGELDKVLVAALD